MSNEANNIKPPAAPATPVAAVPPAPKTFGPNTPAVERTPWKKKMALEMGDLKPTK